MTEYTLFSDFLKELGVPHTNEFSNSAFRGMTFKSLFGLSRLLQSYNIPNAAFKIDEKSEILKIPTPFIAQRDNRMVIVTDISSGTNPTVSWLLFGKPSTAPADEFIGSCTGVVLQAYPESRSCEPDYTRHHFLELAAMAKKWLMALCGAILLIFGVVRAGTFEHVSTVFLLIVNLSGLYVTWLLVLKSMKVKNATSDKICGVLQRHGCDHVLEDKASSFFGIFGWSDVGFAYFSVTLLISLVFPHLIPTLALVNACCLPFTFWSIWYQKFRIKTWCTLCVITQSLLWCQFFCYLLGGWWKSAFPINAEIIMMGVAYLGVMLAINAVTSFINRRSKGQQ